MGSVEDVVPLPKWKEDADKKRESVNALIPPAWRLTTPLPSVGEQKDFTGKYIQQFLSPREIEITETDACGIVLRTSSGQWKAREVAEAFCHRAALAHQMVNCLHEIFFDAALADAQKLDDYYAEHGRPIGPLHGLPVSLKDQFHVKGVETTMGYVGWVGTFEGQKGTGKEFVFESEMVRELRNLGCTLYCKTSVPHTLMSAETVNNIIGYTWNPKNRYLSSGGSSGGEGALIGLRGSPIGFGTDIGGSIRIPAAFNGLYGLRPSSGRLPYEGMANSMDGQNTVLSVVGPLATTVQSLRLLVKGLLSQEPWLHDPLVSEIAWRDANVVDGQALCFAIMKDDGVVTPHPPLIRAIDMVVKAIQKQGHKVIKWDPPSHQRARKIMNSAWTYDGGKDVHGVFALSGEPISDPIKSLYSEAPVEEKTASFISANNLAKRAYQKEYMEYWNSTSALTGTARPVDAVIAPVMAIAAIRPDMREHYGVYSSFVNLLDYSTVVFPVTTVDKNIDKFDEDHKPLSDEDKAEWKLYDPEMYDGAHVSLQLIGRRFQEEKVLALTELVANALAK